MKFSCKKSELLAAVKLVAQTLPSTSTSPSDLNVNLEASLGKLTLVAGANVTHIKTQCDVSVQSPGQCSAVGSLLLSILQEIQTSSEESASVEFSKSSRLIVNSGSAKYEISAFGFVMDLPDIQEETARFSLSAAALRSMVKEVAFVASSAIGINSYNEILLESKNDELTMAATDSVRIAIRSLEVKGLPDFRALLHQSSLNLAVKSIRTDDNIEFILSDDAMMVEFGSSKIRMKLSDKSFPNFRQILPKAQSRSCTVNTADFRAALRGVMPLAQDDKSKVILDFADDKLSFSASSQTLGDAHREIEYKLDGKPIKLAFNGKYLLDFTSVVETEDFKFGVSSSSYPAWMLPNIDDSGYTYIVMPITY